MKFSKFGLWTCIGFTVLVVMVIIIIAIAENKMTLISNKLFHSSRRIERSLYSKSDRDKQFKSLYEQVLREDRKIIILSKTHNHFKLGNLIY